MTMDLKRAAGAAAITAGVGISTLMFGIGPVNAAPLDPPPSPSIPTDPGGPGSVDEPVAPTNDRVAPHSGAGSKGGEPATVEPQPALQIP
jgi:hypothetical protein